MQKHDKLKMTAGLCISHHCGGGHMTLSHSALTSDRQGVAGPRACGSCRNVSGRGAAVGAELCECSEMV